MGKISGIQVKKDYRGKPSHLIINIRKRPDLAEDIMDEMDIEKRMDEPVMPADDVYRKIERKWKK